jgi:hypothetical protein
VNSKLLVFGMLLGLATGCGASTPPAGDAGSDASTDASSATPTPLFNMRYTATTDVTVQMQLVASINALRERIGMQQFDMVDAMAPATSPVGQLLTRLDARFIGANAASVDYSLDRMFRTAVMQGRMATTEDQRAVAEERAEKSLLVALELAMHVELDEAVEEAIEGDYDHARRNFDAAAAYFTGLQSKYESRSTTMVQNVWGMGNSRLTDENLSDRVIEHLVRGRAAVDQMSRRTVIERASTLIVYTSKYYFVSSLNYASAIQTRLASMMSVAGPQAEGGTFYEGVLLPYFGAMPSAAATTARARWRGMPAEITRTAVLRDSGALYGELATASLNGFATADENHRWQAIARVRAIVDVLDEALPFARQDLAMLRTRLDTASMRADANDAAGALMLLNEVQASIATVARVGM